MRAVVVEEFGPAGNMKIVDLPKPAPGAGEVVVRIAASGVNYTDVYHRTGLYKIPLPVSLGSEAAGTVEAVGSGVAELMPGDRVA